jgi:hypothetical protein
MFWFIISFIYHGVATSLDPVWWSPSSAVHDEFGIYCLSILRLKGATTFALKVTKLPH